MSYLKVIGIDEVGRGCLAGPVAACAYVFESIQGEPFATKCFSGTSGTGNYIPAASKVTGLRDSKKLSPKQRQALLPVLAGIGVSGLGMATHEEIDALNIKNATFLAMRRAVEELEIPMAERKNYMIVVDGNLLPDTLLNIGFGAVHFLVKADDKVPEVSAAAVIAKEARDLLMSEKDAEFPGYAFASNAGYGSPIHLQALKDKGFCSMHRKTFEPIKTMVKGMVQDPPTVAPIKMRFR